MILNHFLVEESELDVSSLGPQDSFVSMIALIIEIVFSRFALISKFFEAYTVSFNVAYLRPNMVLET